MSNNSMLDDVLSMISDNTSDSVETVPTSQQSLRDKMLNESRSNANTNEYSAKPVNQTTQEYEEDIEEDDEEDEEDNKGGSKKKMLIIIGAAIALVIVVLIIFSQRKIDNPVEQPPEQLVEQPPIVFEEPIVEEITPVFKINYTYDQIQNLLAVGCTREEIDDWQYNGVNYEYVYHTLMDRYYGWQLSNTLPTYDLTSQEYKDLISSTWLSLPLRTDIEEWTDDDNLAYAYNVKQNLDYEKIPPYGNQLFLKVYLDASSHDSWFFLNITPTDWNLLDDEGNVVVEYTYQTHYTPTENTIDQVEDKENIFITSAKLDIIESMANIAEKNNQ